MYHGSEETLTELHSTVSLESSSLEATSAFRQKVHTSMLGALCRGGRFGLAQIAQAQEVGFSACAGIPAYIQCTADQVGLCHAQLHDEHRERPCQEA